MKTDLLPDLLPPSITRDEQCNLHLPDPLPVLPDRVQGGQVARVEVVFGGAEQTPFLQIIPGIAGIDGNELEHAGVAVAINHAARAAIANEFRFVKFVNVAHRRFPEMATVQVQVPIQVEILVSAEAPELFRLAPQ